MATRVAIMGFGRPGRMAARAILASTDYELVAIQDEHSPKELADLLSHEMNDETMLVNFDEEAIIIGDRKIPVIKTKELPAQGIDMVLGGIYTGDRRPTLDLNTMIKHVEMPSFRPEVQFDDRFGTKSYIKKIDMKYKENKNLPNKGRNYHK